nr:MAG TPA: hypothetical protein [Caudoviricetes sp.]
MTCISLYLFLISQKTPRQSSITCHVGVFSILVIV